MCTCRRACRPCPAASTATMSSIPARSAMISAARPLGSQFVRARARIGSANPARYRAEPHVRLAPQPVVGRRAAARAVQPVRRLFRHQNSARSAVLRAFVLARASPTAPPWRQASCASKSSAANRASSTMTIPGRSRRHPGVSCWRSAAERCFDELDRLLSVAVAGRGRSLRLSAPCGASTAMFSPPRPQSGRLQDAVARRARRHGARRCDFAPAILLAARLEAFRRAHQLPAILRHRLADRDSCGAAGGVRRDPCAHRADDRQGRDRRRAGRSSRRLARAAANTSSGCGACCREGRIYIEKILENDERLKEDWPIDGTVGYEFLAKVNRLWMDDQRTDVLTATYADFTGHSVNFGQLVREKKRAIVEIDVFAASHELLAEAALEDRARRLANAGLESAPIARGAGETGHGAARLSNLPHRQYAG